MRTFEVINPSDMYTLEADDFSVACYVGLILGRGQYGLREIGGEKQDMPIFLLGGLDEWIEKTFQNDAMSFLEETARDKIDAVIACFDSVLIGDPADRAAYNRGLELIDDPEKKKQWKESWLDDRRSSMNNIGKVASIYAEAYREKKEGKVA